MKFNLGDIISTTVLLCMFLAIFFVMIHMIKKNEIHCPCVSSTNHAAASRGLIKTCVDPRTTSKTIN